VPKKTKLSKSSLHWFIRSRPYVLLAELRRRFDLDGSDEVRAIQTPGGTTYVGLPDRAARLIEDLVRENRVGLECTAEVQARLAVGVYAYDLLKAPIGIQRTNGFHRPPPNGMRPGTNEQDDRPDEDVEPPEGAEGAVAEPPTPAAFLERGRLPERPRFDRPGDRRQGDRRQSDRRDFGRPRGAPGPDSAAGPARDFDRPRGAAAPDGAGGERRPGARPDLPRRDRPGRPDLPRPRSERPGVPPPGRRPDGRERRGPDRPGTRSERPSPPPPAAST
jgi:hypothetical protein